mmetsp:Transcript_2705/g.12196  ORF Transcript_2705/g.12196 Transcript_2705/m.12196 type:complete len:371 (+) Transcript_2705:359-1471(+)
MVVRGGIPLRRFGALGADGQLRAAPSRVPGARPTKREPRGDQQHRGRRVGDPGAGHRRRPRRQATIVGSGRARDVGGELVAIVAQRRRAFTTLAPGRPRRRGVPRHHPKLLDRPRLVLVLTGRPGRDGRRSRGFVQPRSEQPRPLPMGPTRAVRGRPGIRRGAEGLVRTQPRTESAALPTAGIRQRDAGTVGRVGAGFLLVAVAAAVRGMQGSHGRPPGFPVRRGVAVAGGSACRDGEDDANHGRVRADGRHRHPRRRLRRLHAQVRAGQQRTDPYRARVVVPRGRRTGPEQAAGHPRRPQRPRGGQDTGAPEPRDVRQSLGDPRVHRGNRRVAHPRVRDRVRRRSQRGRQRADDGGQVSGVRGRVRRPG